MVYKYEKLGEELIKILKQRRKNGKKDNCHKGIRGEASSGCRENMRTVLA